MDPKNELTKQDSACRTAKTHCDALRDALLKLLELLLEAAAEDSGSGPDSKEPKLRSSPSSSPMLVEAEVPSLSPTDRRDDVFWRSVPEAADFICLRRRRFSEMDFGSSLPSPSLRPGSMAKY